MVHVLPLRRSMRILLSSDDRMHWDYLRSSKIWKWLHTAQFECHGFRLWAVGIGRLANTCLFWWVRGEAFILCVPELHNQFHSSEIECAVWFILSTRMYGYICPLLYLALRLCWLLHMQWLRRADTAIFLYDTSTRTLHGVFYPTQIGYNLEVGAWGGRFPAQVSSCLFVVLSQENFPPRILSIAVFIARLTETLWAFVFSVP